MIEQITKAIRILVGYSYINPDTKFVYFQLNATYINVGFFDEDNSPFTLYEDGEYQEDSNRYREVFTTKGFLDQYDELGVDTLTKFFNNKQLQCAIQDIDDIRNQHKRKTK